MASQPQACALGARRKERLWPHIREFADNGIAHTKRMLSALGENGTPCELYAVHGHYADAGEVRRVLNPENLKQPTINPKALPCTCALHMDSRLEHEHLAS